MQRQKRRRRIRLITLSVRLIAAFILSVMLVVITAGVLLLKDREALFIYANDNKPRSKTSQQPAMIKITDSSTHPLMTASSGNTVSQDDPAAEPMVRIVITEPDGWYNKAVKIKVIAEDIANAGNFTIQSVKAKIGQNGSWMDITDHMSFEMSENGTVYVEVTDTKGNIYSKNARMVCFDYTKPTLNSAVNNGTLTVQASDTDSGIRAIYVNGFEFTNLTNGTINIRMEQFDTGYQYFTVQAMDNAGNMSETYRVNNPYYSNGDNGNKYKLPDSAEATKPASSTAKVTDHIKTDSLGNTLSLNKTAASSASKTEEKKKALAEADSQEKPLEYATVSGQGREFYTIEAKTGKVFYLIIDRDGDNEEVHFVTDITENDLLNVTEENSETLPKNMAVPESEEYAIESGLPNNNNNPAKTKIDEGSTFESFFGKKEAEEEAAEAVSEEQVSANDSREKKEEEDKNNRGLKQYLFFGIVMAIAAAAAIALKKLKRNGDERYVEDEENDPDEDGDLPDDDGDEDTEREFYDEPPDDEELEPIEIEPIAKKPENQTET